MQFISYVYSVLDVILDHLRNRLLPHKRSVSRFLVTYHRIEICISQEVYSPTTSLYFNIFNRGTLAQNLL